MVLAISSAILFFVSFAPWYAHVAKPDFALPIFILAPIHSLIILVSGFGAQIVMGNVSGNPAVKPARRFYGIWLFMHSIWLLIFVGFHYPVLGLGVAVIQWGVSVFCIQNFFNVDPKAGRRVLAFFLLTTYWMLVNGSILALNNHL